MVWSLRSAAGLVFLTGLVGLVEATAWIAQALLTGRTPVVALACIPAFALLAWIHGHVARAAREGHADHAALRAAFLLLVLAAGIAAVAVRIAPPAVVPQAIGPLLASTALGLTAVLAVMAWCHVRFSGPEVPWHRVPAIARDRLAARRIVAALALTALTMFFAAVFLAGMALLPGQAMPLWVAAVPLLLCAALAHMWSRSRRLFALREDVHALAHEARGTTMVLVPFLAVVVALAVEVPAATLIWVPAWLALGVAAVCLVALVDPLARLSAAGA